MTYDPERHHRRSIRFRGYDYAQAGAYFVTLCTQDRACLFGGIVDGEMRLNETGLVVADTWRWLAVQHPYVELDEWVVMPNHLHGIIVIVDDPGRGGSRTAPTQPVPTVPTVRTAPTQPGPATARYKPLGRLIGAFKTVSTKRVNEMRRMPGAPIWQRNYYEHIIRHEESMNRIRQYILDNPARWAFDRENLQAISPEREDLWLA
jgi:REP element-mobilizing transposase RayT